MKGNQKKIDGKQNIINSQQRLLNRGGVKSEGIIGIPKISERN